MAKSEKQKEKPTPMRCIYGSAAIWSKARPGFFYACTNCLVRGGWRKTLDQATESWNTEVLQSRNERRF
jgi:hypothetical protein